MQQFTEVAVTLKPIPFSSIAEAVSATTTCGNGIEYMVARCVPTKPPFVHPERGKKQLDTRNRFLDAFNSTHLEFLLKEEKDFDPDRGDKILVLLPEQLAFKY